jgi:hypothetical protein
MHKFTFFSGTYQGLKSFHEPPPDRRTGKASSARKPCTELARSLLAGKASALLGKAKGRSSG